MDIVSSDILIRLGSSINKNSNIILHTNFYNNFRLVVYILVIHYSLEICSLCESRKTISLSIFYKLLPPLSQQKKRYSYIALKRL